MHRPAYARPVALNTLFDLFDSSTPSTFSPQEPLMPTNRWRGDAPAVAQVQTVTIGTNDVATTYKGTINGKTVSVPGNAGRATSTATHLANALTRAAVPQAFTEITSTVP